MRGQNILRELNGLARDVGAPVDGTNISEQVAALKGHMASDITAGMSTRIQSLQLNRKE